MDFIEIMTLLTFFVELQVKDSETPNKTFKWLQTN